MLKDTQIINDFSMICTENNGLNILRILIFFAMLVCLMAWGIKVGKLVFSDSDVNYRKVHSEDFKKEIIIKCSIIVVLLITFIVLTITRSASNIQAKAIKNDSWSVVETKLLGKSVNVRKDDEMFYVITLDKFKDSIEVPEELYKKVSNGSELSVVVATNKSSDEYKNKYIILVYPMKYDGTHLLN